MSLDRVEKFWNQSYIKTIAPFFIYTSTFQTKSTVLFQYTDFLITFQRFGLLAKIEQLIWLHKNMLPGTTIGNLYAS